MLPLILAALGFYLLYAGYSAATKRDKRFRKGSKFVMNGKTMMLWIASFLLLAAAAFYINHA